MKYWNRQTIKQIREHYFSAVYFSRTQAVLLKENLFTPVTMQVFQRNDHAVLCGIDEVVELFRKCAGYYKNKKWVSGWEKISIKTLRDGDIINAKEPVMHITGPYVYFAHLESLYLGILASRTLVATNTKRIVEAANQKPVYFFGDRFDHFLNQEGDGYAAHISGVSGVCTPAHAKWFNGKPMGTLPHALIALTKGDTIAAAKLFSKHFPQVPLIVLVDFQNDCVKTALGVARVFGQKLWGVRIDTSGDVVDVSLNKNSNQIRTGVTPELVRLVRTGLDQAGFNYVKIIVSGGFNEEKVGLFERFKVPVDGYGVGSAILKGNYDFTADVVLLEGKPMAKVGRKYQTNPRLRQVKE